MPLGIQAPRKRLQRLAVLSMTDATSAADPSMARLQEPTSFVSIPIGCERDRRSVQATTTPRGIGRLTQTHEAVSELGFLHRLWQTAIVWWSTLIVLCGTLLMPLAVVDVPPLLDYPNHLARAYVLAWGRQDAFLSHMYAPHWAIIPNLAVDLILPPLLWIMPVHVAGRVLLAVALLLPVIGTVLYSNVVFGRRSYWSVAVCLVACNGLFLLGFMNFQIGIGLALVCAAAWLRWRETHPVFTVAIGAICAVLLFFCHLMGLLFYLILLASYEVERFWTSYRQSGSPIAIAIRRSVWLLPVLAPPIGLFAVSPFASVGSEITRESGYTKLIRAAMSLVNYNLSLDIISSGCLAVFLLTCAGLRLISAPARSAVALGAVGVLYAVAPFGFMGTGYVDARFAVMFGFLLFASVQPVRLPNRAALLVAVAVVALFGLRTSQVAVVWYAHNRDLAELRDAMSVVDPGSRVLLAMVDAKEVSPAQHIFLRRQHLSDGSRLDAHTAALLLIERHAFWTFLFAEPTQQPIQLRSPYREIEALTLGIPDIRLMSVRKPDAGDLLAFPMAGRWWCFYDYMLLLEAGARPDFSDSNLELLRKSDYANLFRIRHPTSVAATADKFDNALDFCPSLWR
jgi:hypothetical protein